MGIGIEHRELNLIDYVCFTGHMLKHLPEADKKHILSARIEVFPHESAVDFLIDKKQLMRYCLCVLYDGAAPPQSLRQMLQDLSGSMIDNYYKTPEERGKKSGADYGGLERLQKKLGDDVRFYQFFSYDENAVNILRKFATVQQAINDPNCRQVLMNSLSSVHKGEARVDRIGPSRKTSTLYIALNNEVYDFDPFERAASDYFEKVNEPEIRRLLFWPLRQSPGPLADHQFMDNMSVSGLKRTLEQRYNEMKAAAHLTRSY